ncbi:Modification methylase RsrI [Tepidimonas thermarum]|uniref:site-specific DNA-methyltransferase (adenine-specific) n=2 Tax=Tepidimonas thermarum TaxID=335431 RepID=A0A554X0Q1_9BURK|nr:DNA modification methylase [Tepidimonas thermarum]TSE29422.1 Modification methylase RsrI [Tepidimonas thermarum]
MLADKIELWPTSRLIPYARNPRKNDHAVEQMAAAITEFGFRIPIIAKSTGEVVDGHLRLKAALRLGLETVPVILADDLTPAQIKAFRILANRSATWADWDEDLLRLELEELKLDDFDLALTGFDADELLEIMAGEETTTEGNTDEDAAPEVPVNPVSKPGDVWIMGQHRLLCGDATDPASYDTLLGTERVAMIFQDPPYNVDYANSPKDKLRGTHRPILNDNLGEGFQAFLLAALKPALQRCDGAIYIAMSSSELDTLQSAFRAAGGHWSTFIIWAKNTFTLGRSDYQRQYEPILYGWREGANRHWCGDRDQGDVWEIKKPAKNALHPTQKPVEVPERAIRNSSRPGSLVLDCFGGSGSTLIACERTGRVCRVMELDPKYCDVIVRRWQDWTGQKAQRADDGLLFDELASDQPLEAGMID